MALHRGLYTEREKDRYTQMLEDCDRYRYR